MVVSPLPVTVTSPLPATATDAIYDSSHHFKGLGRLFLNATSGTHMYFDKETNAGEVLFYQLVARDTGLPSAAPLLRGYAKGEFLALTQIGDGVMLLTLNAVGNCSAPSLLLHVFDALILMPLRLFGK
ncbi:unnamed protein product [Brassica oleracea]